jgi:hypothetical protein
MPLSRPECADVSAAGRRLFITPLDINVASGDKSDGLTIGGKPLYRLMLASCSCAAIRMHGDKKGMIQPAVTLLV